MTIIFNSLVLKELFMLLHTLGLLKSYCDTFQVQYEKTDDEFILICHTKIVYPKEYMLMLNRIGTYVPKLRPGEVLTNKNTGVSVENNEFMMADECIIIKAPEFRSESTLLDVHFDGKRVKVWENKIEIFNSVSLARLYDMQHDFQIMVDDKLCRVKCEYELETI